MPQIPFFISLGQKPFLESHGNAPNSPGIGKKADTIRGMKNKKSSIQFVHPNPLNSNQRLAQFFELLMKIDKRNNPRLYEHNQGGTSPNQATQRFDGICMRGD